ncbi:peptidase C25 [Bacteroidia bacterium]|nr:peptidase C25 [Bacteroidia bacterium]
MKVHTTYFGLLAALFFIGNSICLAQKINDGSRYAQNSVLASGKWVQLKVSDNAVYKLTFDDIKRCGINPEKVKIYGYGGWILDEDFSKPYIDDLPEVSVYINKGADNIFNSGDYLLFYGRGTVKWTYNGARGYDVFEHENNPYSQYGYYFMTESDLGPKEIETLASVSSPNAKNVAIFDDYAVHERDSITVSNTGRELFGESFIGAGKSTRSFSFNIPGIVSDSVSGLRNMVKLSFVANPASSSKKLSLLIGNDTIIRTDVPNDLGQYKKATMKDIQGYWLGTNERIIATVNYDVSGQNHAYLNFIALNVKRKLQFYNTGYTAFRHRDSRNNPMKYTIENATNSCMVWNITQVSDIRLMQTQSNGNQMTFGAENNNVLQEYVMVDYSKSFPSPEIIPKEIANQNLHSLPQLDMVIIAPTVFLQQAKVLAEKHRTSSGLKVEVVDQKWIFNEFSSGAPDATAYRRFMKMFYDRAVSESEKPKYLLLFGDGFFDNRHLTAIGAKANPDYYLLTFQMKESLNEYSSYGTDDYFGFLDDNEGTNWPFAVIDLGIGRFPVSSLAKAADMVTKVTTYMDNKLPGNWKNKIIFTADNTDSYNASDFCHHAKESNEVANIMDKNHPEYALSKYYMDAYKAVTVNGKSVYPETKKAFLNKLNEGCFLLNYTGHGSTTAWSSEDMLNITDVRQMNFEALPLWITATCNFGWFDNLITSAGEEAFLNKKGGAIALFTTSRVVYSSSNLLINKQLIKYLFQVDKDGKHLCLGDVLRRSKIALGGDWNKLNYILLGDPALELNYPKMKVQLESINGDTIGGQTFSFKALEKITLAGSILDEQGNKIDGFSGKIKADIYDSKQTIESVVMDNDGKRFSFSTYPNTIYSGDDEVKNGSFDFSFIVPLDISYTKDNGKMTFYAHNTQSLQDADGAFGNYILAGTSDDIYNENAPKIVEMFLNTESFKNEDDVNETPFFFAKVYDEMGINRSGSGLGHDIIVSIDNNPAWTYNLNAKNQMEVIYELVQVQSENLKLAEKVYSQTMALYTEGLASITDLLETETSLHEVKIAYTTELIRYKKTEIDLLKASGTLKYLLSNN